MRGREPPLGELQRGRHDLLEAHRPVELQGRQPGVAGGGNDAARDAARNLAVGVEEQLQRHRLRPSAKSADRHDLVRLGDVDDDRRHAAEARHVGQRDVDRDPRRHAGVDGVSALLQHAVPGRGGQVVPRRHHVRNAADARPVRCDAVGRHICLRVRSLGVVTARPSTRDGLYADGPRAASRCRGSTRSPTRSAVRGERGRSLPRAPLHRRLRPGWPVTIFFISASISLKSCCGSR